jgi:hypothetical protein
MRLLPFWALTAYSRVTITFPFPLLSLTSVVHRKGGQLHAQTTLPPGKKGGTHRTGDCVGSRAGLDGCGE